MFQHYFFKPSKKSKQLDISLVDIARPEEVFLRILIDTYSAYRDIRPRYHARISAASIAATLVRADRLVTAGNIVFVDIDSGAGLNAWYTLRTLDGSGAIIVVTATPASVRDKSSAAWILAKPLRAKAAIGLLNRAIDSSG